MKKIFLFAITLMLSTQQVLAFGASKTGCAGWNTSKVAGCTGGSFISYWIIGKLVMFALGVFIFSLIFWATFKWVVKDGCCHEKPKKKKVTK